MKIVTILGARPQFIKAGSVGREIMLQREAGADITEIIVHTGQHYQSDMSKVFFDEMQIPKPNFYLGIGGKSHGAMTGQMIEKIEKILIHEQPDWVMVYGDTNSTLAGAIAASKLNIKIAHVEAGLRSFNVRMPEEINRILTDRVSSLLFCPTKEAVNNLNNEGISHCNPNTKVVLSGDVMFDGAIFYKKLAKKPIDIKLSNNFVLCTIHRAENTDNTDRLAQILAALNEVALTKQVILPLHPRTKKVIEASDLDTSNLTISNPVGYLNMVWLINNCSLVITDSGGLQKEAFFYNKRCLITRDETEWGELIEIGANVLVGADKSKILYNFNSSYKNAESVDVYNNLFGIGNASHIIVKELMDG